MLEVEAGCPGHHPCGPWSEGAGGTSHFCSHITGQTIRIGAYVPRLQLQKGPKQTRVVPQKVKVRDK